MIDAVLLTIVVHCLLSMSIVSVISVTIACCKLYFRQYFDLIISPVLLFLSSAVFEQFTYQLRNKECLTAISRLCPFCCYKLMTEHFGESHATLWLMVAKLWCIKLCAFFSVTPCSTTKWNAEIYRQGESQLRMELQTSRNCYNVNTLCYICCAKTYLLWLTDCERKLTPRLMVQVWGMCLKCVKTAVIIAGHNFQN